MLRIYAYYKQATQGNMEFNQVVKTKDLRNAFKTNAWMQISHLTPDEAKTEYIAIINTLTDKK
jgi:acyl-CoA-binding protein